MHNDNISITGRNKIFNKNHLIIILKDKVVNLHIKQIVTIEYKFLYLLMDKNKISGIDTLVFPLQFSVLKKWMVTFCRYK